MLTADKVLSESRIAVHEVNNNPLTTPLPPFGRGNPLVRGKREARRLRLTEFRPTF